MRVSDQEANRLLVLKTIRREEPVARTDLTRLTALGSATITQIVGGLVARNIVLEARSPPGRGRPRMQLMLNPDAAYVVGATMVAGVGLTAEVCNMRGDRLFAHTAPLRLPARLQDLAETIANILQDAIELSGVDRTLIHSIGVALPAVVDSISGVLHWLLPSPPQPVAIAEIIQSRLNLPVTLDNTVNIMARAEHWFGEDRQVDDFSLFVVGMGIGFSQYAGGELRVGSHGMTAQLGHVKVGAGDEGPRCVCGARGCLEVTASAYGIMMRICERRGKGPPNWSELNETLQNFVQEAHAGDPVAREAFEYAGRLLGVTVANHINLADPARVILLVLHPEMADLFAPAFYAAVLENTLPVFRGRAAVQLKAAAEACFSHGAAAIVLETLYRAPSGAGQLSGGRTAQRLKASEDGQGR